MFGCGVLRIYHDHFCLIEMALINSDGPNLNACLVRLGIWLGKEELQSQKMEELQATEEFNLTIADEEAKFSRWR